MFGLGMSEIFVILVIALIVIGPKKLPEIAKSLGKAMGEFKRATNDLKDSFSLNDPPQTYRPMDTLSQSPAVTVNGDPAKPLEAAADAADNVTPPESEEKAGHDRT